MAATLSRSTNRPADLVARYGGEEFACLLPTTDLKGALVAAEKVRKNIAELQIPHAHSSAAEHVTVSVGVASMTPTLSSRPEQLIAAADQALYQAKEKGRNRVMAA